MIYEHFRATGALWSGTRTLRFVQYTFAEWRRPRLRRSMGACSIISKRHAFRCDPGRIVQVKITGLCSSSGSLGFVRSRNRSKQWTDKLFTIEEVCETSYWSDEWDLETSDSGAKLWKEEQSPRVKKEREPTLRGKLRSVFSGRHMDNVREETACSFSHDRPASGDSGGGQRRKGRSSSSAPNSKAKTKSSKTSGNRKESSSEKMSEIPCRYNFFKLKARHFKIGILPCVVTASLKRWCKYGRTCFFRHVEAEEKPSKKSKKGGAKGSVELLKESTQLGCVSEGSYPRKSFLREKGKLGSKHAVKFSKSIWHQIKIRERKGPSRGMHPQVWTSWAQSLRPKIRGRITWGETLHQERCARRVAWDLAKIFTGSRMRTMLRSILLLKTEKTKKW